jgi:hypothetical protein
MKEMKYKQLSELFEYNPETGVITNKVNRRRAKEGEVATVKGPKGYLRVCVNYHQLLAHRVSWVLHSGKDIPEGMTIDHINGDIQDNTIKNLRILSLEDNSGRLGRTQGVQPIKGKWRARIKVKGKTTYGCYRDTPLKAHHDYLELVRVHRVG